MRIYVSQPSSVLQYVDLSSTFSAPLTAAEADGPRQHLLMRAISSKEPLVSCLWRSGLSAHTLGFPSGSGNSHSRSCPLIELTVLNAHDKTGRH